MSSDFWPISIHSTNIVCLDKLTYAGNLKTLEDVASLPN